jgi:diguanylate cyclase (GGDEF)-like protein
MTLDINTLLVVTVANIVLLALISPAVMGSQLGPAARYARWSLIMHAASWVCMITSNFWPETGLDRLLSTLSIAGFAATHWLLFRALQEWLGARRFDRLIRYLAVLAPVGYFILFGSYALRVGWANFLLAGQLVVLMTACFETKTSLNGRWRHVVALALLIMIILTAGRGALGAFTDLYPSFLTPHPWNVAAMVMTTLVPVMVNFAILGGWHEEAENAMHLQAVTDAMTGLLNRRGWAEVAQPLLAQANRYDLALGMLLVDIDHFKKINDSHGHAAGDRALRVLADLLKETSRASDVVARVGGEEFCLLLPGTSLDAANRLDGRLRQRLPGIASSLGHPLDFSSGLAIRRPGDTLEEMMRRADRALYAAKDAGRGRLMVSSDISNGDKA